MRIDKSFFCLLIVTISLSAFMLNSQTLTVNGQSTRNLNISNEVQDTSYSSNIMQESEDMLGIVKDGTFISADTKNPLLLTHVLMQEARTPESGRIDLQQYEGKAILVLYQQADSEIVWGAEIADVAGPILSKVVESVFGFE